ncbi:sigma-70 family RNA polymerase sigma factor [Nocardia yamanashiensis]|uniref:sigma-70 family RNA polymerase sigma factor n=1 Tax=Nocardia yamanashiensis TaxID=209247 RepID=UPI00082BA01B|nr:sigma-70 family RNA polymerase sigma factor [Nocardia yamanashiensis]
MIDTEEFALRTMPYRRELLAHCYRMVGSVDDAEDLVQETLLRAWRGYPEFEGRASVRTWLYRIATNTCLNALEHSSRRVLPSGLGDPTEYRGRIGPDSDSVPWLQPIPDAYLETTDPEAIVAARHGTRLALIAAWQCLPPKQRAVLILRDVLHWKATEVASLLDTTPTAVNSSLQRAHATLADSATDADRITEPDDPMLRAVLDRYAAAFESLDMDALAQLLKEDVVWEMPPIREWFAGRPSVVHLIATQCPSQAGDVRMIPTAANGQPAFAMYLNGEAHSIQVLTATPTGIERVTAFHGPERFEPFGLPKSL